MGDRRDEAGEPAEDLTGRTVIITGANSGLGLASAHALAARGARVILACRDQSRGERACGAIADAMPGAEVRLELLDLAQLASVDSFARRILDREPRIDVLMNNAGVMALPRRLTIDGFEMQLGVNHLGHFALTGLLLPRLLETGGARVVNVSSLAHWFGRMRFHDPMGEARYDKWMAYGQSKLANLLFTFELQRRCHRRGQDLLALAAHPGYAATNLQMVGPEMEGSRLGRWMMAQSNRLFADDAAGGAQAQVHAAAAPGVEPGGFYGPGVLQLRGKPRRVRSSAAARDAEAAARLWTLSVELTGVAYDELC